MMNKSHSLAKAGLILCVTFLVLSSCHDAGKHPDDTPTTGSITIAADETFKPVLEAEIQVFQAIYPYAHIRAVYKTETEALNDLFHDSVRLIIATRPLSSKENDAFNNRKLFPKSLKIATDAIALIVNKENPDTLLSTPVFREILQSKITRWKQVNPSSKLGDIRVVFDNKNSSTVRYMIDSICRGANISRQHAAVVTNEEVIGRVIADRNLIGVLGVSWISDIDDPKDLSFLHYIRVVELSHDSIPTIDNAYQPFQAYMSKEWYPLTRDVYVINSEPRTGLATGFTAFLASERGQRIILKAGILPATQPYRIIEVNDNF